MRALAGRKIFVVGVGGAGMSAYALLAKAWGADVAGWDRNDTPYAERLRADGIRVTISAEPEPPAGWEVFVSSAYSFPGRSRAELLAELVSLRTVDRGLGYARQDHDRRHDRFLPRAAGPRSGVRDRRRDSATRRKRRRGGGLAGGRGRRVRPYRRAVTARDRRRHQRRAGPPHDVLVRSRGRGHVRALAVAHPTCGARLGAGGARDRARASRTPQPAERGFRARRARAGGDRSS